jgi:hypothetical protein
VPWLSGNWRWTEGWIFGVWFSTLFATILLWLYYKDPGLLAERFRRPGTDGQSRSDLAIPAGIKAASIRVVHLAAVGCAFRLDASSARSPTIRISHNWSASRRSAGTV